MPFPTPGPKVLLTYRYLHDAEHGNPEQRRKIDNPDLLPRPWDPATCTDVDLRLQVWEWLEAAVAWLNHEQTWDLADMIPTCWPHHPHLVREIAVLPDQRRRAGLDTTSNSLEEWNRYALPAFTDRMRDRLRSHCEEGHQPWPGRSRHNQHLSDSDTERPEDLYARDTNALATPHADAGPQFWVVDLDTAELTDRGGTDGE